VFNDPLTLAGLRGMHTVGVLDLSSATSGRGSPSGPAADERNGSSTNGDIDERLDRVKAGLLSAHGVLTKDRPESKVALFEELRNLSTELKSFYRERKAMEDRISQAEHLLAVEREAREAWMQSFQDALRKTLGDLSGCIDQSMMDSNRLMAARFADSEALLLKLLSRVEFAMQQQPQNSSFDQSALSASECGDSAVGGSGGLACVCGTTCRNVSAPPVWSQPRLDKSWSSATEFRQL